MIEGLPSVIDLFEEPTVDDYGTWTLGRWGGYLVQVMPMLFNDRVVLTPEDLPMAYDHGWCYPKGAAAFLAVAAWDPETEAEPAGYKKRVNPRVRQPGEKAFSASGPASAP